MQSFSAESARTLRRSAVAAAMGAGLMMSATSAFAVIVWSGPVNLAIPTTTAGLYVNVVTGVSAPAPAGAPGWDINPWSSTGLSFFTSTAAPNTATTTGTVGVLPFGASIGGSSTFTVGTVTPPVGAWALNSTNNYVGFRFLNEAGGTVHYGWMQIGLGASLLNRTLVSYAFESTPLTAIQAGVVPEPGTYALMGLGLAGLMVAARRRKQA